MSVITDTYHRENNSSRDTLRLYYKRKLVQETKQCKYYIHLWGQPLHNANTCHIKNRTLLTHNLTFPPPARFTIFHNISRSRRVISPVVRNELNVRNFIFVFTLKTAVLFISACTRCEIITYVYNFKTGSVYSFLSPFCEMIY